jgi:hypothetical protein
MACQWLGPACDDTVVGVRNIVLVRVPNLRRTSHLGCLACSLARSELFISTCVEHVKVTVPTTRSDTMHVFALGASRATGYHTALGEFPLPWWVVLTPFVEYLQRGYVVTILLRSPAVLQEDPAFKQYLDTQQVRLVKGDATNEKDVLTAWKDANSSVPVDLVFFSLGPFSLLHFPNVGLLTFAYEGPASKFKLFRGFVTDTPNVSTLSFLHVMRAIAQTSAESVPRIVVVSAKSVTPGALALNPAPARLIIGWVLRGPNLDKRGMEAIAFHGLGKNYEEGMTPGEPILPDGWRDTLPPAGWAKRTAIVRPPELTDGPATGKYRASATDFLVRRISRRDLGNYIAGPLEDKWNEFVGEVITVGY